MHAWHAMAWDNTLHKKVSSWLGFLCQDIIIAILSAAQTWVTELRAYDINTYLSDAYDTNIWQEQLEINLVGCPGWRRSLKTCRHGYYLGTYIHM
jgi:hypothetical protein